MKTSDAMTKAEALALLGGTQAEAASRIGCTQQAIQAWPPTLTPKLRDRVQAALWREWCEQIERERARRERAKIAAEPSAIQA